MRQSPFLQKVSDEMMRRRYAKRTIQTYIYWVRRFILFHQKRHSETMGDAEVEAIDVKTTQIYTHVLQMGGNTVKSPFSCLGARTQAHGF